jgi:hypothetical protein
MLVLCHQIMVDVDNGRCNEYFAWNIACIIFKMAELMELISFET